MPMKAPRICSCGHKVAFGILCQCQQRRKAEADQRRPTAHQRGYDSKWQRESRMFLALPGNSHCSCGCGRIANVVDHVIPHKGNKRLFWDRRNWAPMNSHCHNSTKQSLERSMEANG
ncbi:MAG: HNH endonuclease [Pseudomonadota bacterium]|nr:HNH endonuclease [Aerococcus mictus]